jgi:hypothetical protein
LQLVQDVLEGVLREGGGSRVFNWEPKDAKAVARAPSHLRDCPEANVSDGGAPRTPNPALRNVELNAHGLPLLLDRG